MTAEVSGKRRKESMSKVFLEEPIIPQLERYLDLSSRRHSIISSNLSNVDTPNYKTKDVNFAGELESAMGEGVMATTVTNARHLPASIDMGGQTVGQVKEVEGLTLRNDLNNVNVDREMSRMAANSIMFAAISQLVAGRFRTLKAAILEGR
jgi:flagellar basal-body rod protein FlgB